MLEQFGAGLFCASLAQHTFEPAPAAFRTPAEKWVTAGRDRRGGGFEECGIAVSRLRALVKITVPKALPLISPAYDRGLTESELRRIFTTRFRKLQPNERFEE